MSLLFMLSGSWGVTAGVEYVRRQNLLIEAGSPSITAQRLEEIYQEARQSNDAKVLAKLALNKKPPVDMLRNIFSQSILYYDSENAPYDSYSILYALARNTHTPDEILHDLSRLCRKTR